MDHNRFVMRPAWVLAAIPIGGVAALGVLLSPLTGASRASDVILPAVLPLGFYAAGLVAAVLLPAQPVGHRLLAVGTLHLAAFALAIVAPLLGQPEATWFLSTLGLAAYWLGFVALFDAVVRYPDGAYAIDGLRRAVPLAALAAVAAAAVGALGSAQILSVLDGSVATPNPFRVPPLQPVVGVAGALPLLPFIGLLIMLVRYRGASADDRAQMRWPIGATVAVVVGIVTTGLLQESLGRPIQSAIFIVVASALPAAFLIGLLRQAREGDRVAVLEAARRRVADATVEERRRIERDLHDGAQQHLVALKVKLGLAEMLLGRDPERATATLDQLKADADDALETLRDLARGIYPPLLAERGLVVALESQARKATVPVTVSGDGVGRYSQDVEAAVYFSVLEALQNVQKYAGASGVVVRLHADNGRLRFAVEDDGRGFDVASVSRGSGLTNMEDRLDALGGELRVASSIGTGTSLEGWLAMTPRETMPAVGSG